MWSLTQEQLCLLIESIPAGIIKLDPEGCVSFANTAALSLLGYDSGELLGKPLHEYVHQPPGRNPAERARCPVLRSRREGRALPLRDEVFWRKDGSPLPVRGISAPVRKDEQTLGTVLFFQDTSESRNLKERMQAIFTTSADAYLFFDERHNLLDCNPAVARLFGTEQGDFSTSFTRYAAVGENAAPDFFARLDSAFAQGGCHFAWNWKDARGAVVPTDVTLHRIRLRDQPAVFASVHDLRDLRQAEAQVEQERARLAQTINASPLGVCQVSQGIVRQMNPHLAEMTALKIGDRLDGVIIHGEARRAIEESLSRGGPVAEMEVAVRGPGDSVRHVLLSAMPERGRQDSFLYWLVDITPLKETEKDLVQAKERAEAATRAKSSFLARMSHEIRTPMNAILGMGYLLRQSGLNSQQMEHLDKIQSAATGLVGLLNNILEFSQLESGQIASVRAPFLLGMLLEDALGEVREKARQRGLGWELEVAPDVPARLVGDAPRLGQILAVLGDNALKFTETGSISVSVSLEASDGDELWLHFRVRDTGIGMQPEHLEQVFQSFTQADGSLTRRYGGTGLGLSIARHLVDLVGGRMWAESISGEGSVFHCVLPFPRGAADQDLETACGVTPTGLAGQEGCQAVAEKPCILLVEDNEINQEIACELLSAMNLQVDVAENGEQALEAVQAKRYDIIFMDIQMPVMDGLEATRRIRAGNQDWAREVPIIAMTAHALSDDREQSLAAGMNAHLTKPINPEALQRVVAIWLPDRVLAEPGQPGQTVAPAPAPELDLSSLHGINISSGISNVAGNENLYLDLLRRFAAKYRDSHHELPELLAAFETESAARLAHTIKGVAANLGANRLAGIAKDIESAILAGDPIEALLGPYTTELHQVAQSIDQLIASRDAQDQDDGKYAELDPVAVPRILGDLEQLPVLMQTDWGRAQETVEALGALLAHTDVGSLYQRLLNALEEFDVVEFANAAEDLKQRLR